MYVFHSSNTIYIRIRMRNFFAIYINIYKECVMSGGATIDNDINNNKQ